MIYRPDTKLLRWHMRPSILPLNIRSYQRVGGKPLTTSPAFPCRTRLQRWPPKVPSFFDIYCMEKKGDCGCGGQARPTKKKEEPAKPKKNKGTISPEKGK